MKMRLLVSSLLVAACGGSNPSNPSFALHAPATVQVVPGTHAYIDVSVEKLQGFTGDVAITIDAPPGLDGILIGMNRVDVNVAKNLAPGKQTLTLIGKSGMLESRATVELDVQAPLASPTKQVELKVTLDALFYAPGQQVKVTVDFGTMSPPAAITDIIVVSSESQDVEKLTLTRGAGNTFTSTTVPVQASTEKGTTLDGTFTLPAGGLFFAMFPIDRTWPGFESYETALLSDFAFLEGTRPGLPTSRVEPALALSPDEKTPVPGARAVGTLVRVGGGKGSGQPIQLATEELILFHKDAAELQRFVTASGGQVLDTQDVEGDLPFSSLVKVDPMSLSPERLALMRGLLEDQGELVGSNAKVAGIYGLAMMFRLEGFGTAVNPRLQYQGAPTVNEPERSALLPSMVMRGSTSGPACLPNDIGSRRCATDVPALWTYMDLMDLDTQRVKVAVLDMGFAPNADFRTNLDGGIDQCDVTGRSFRCGAGTALGTPTVGASLVGERVWHGTGVVTTLGGMLDNGLGGAGTGGQVAVPMLYKYDFAAYAFDMGNGMRHAVSNGAQVINISAGYPCNAVMRVGPDFDFCSVEGRTAICAVVTLAAHAAAIAFCTSPAAGIPIGGAIACGVLVGIAVAATGACLSTLALGNVRAPMQSAVSYATSRGVPVVTSAGNRLPPEAFPEPVRALLDLSESRTEVWGMVPAVIPNVVVCGAAREDNLGNEHFFGDRVDVWAPIPSRYFSPMSVDDPLSPLVQGEIGGTSAAAPYVAGVIAAMQAANPSLDPARATDTEKSTAVSRVRSILAATALTNAQLSAMGWLNDPVERRNLIDPLRAVEEAARGHQPDLAAMGYDTSLNFSELDGNDDSAAVARAIPFDTVVNGTIFSFDATQDQDWKRYTVPVMAGRVFGSDVTVMWVGNDEPTTTGASPAFPRVSTTGGTEKSSTYRVVRASGDVVQFAMTARAGEDAPYKVTVSTPVALAPTMAITSPVVLPMQTLCANRAYTFRAQGTYPFTTLTVPSVEWLIDGVLQASTALTTTFTRPAGTDVFTARAFGATATLNVTFVACTATAEILVPATNQDEYGMLGDPNGIYLQFNFSGRALDAAGAVINPATLVFEWTTDRADLQPGAPTTGSQLLGTGATLSGIRIYIPGGSTGDTHHVTLTVRAMAGGPALSTDTVTIIVRNLI